MLHQVQFFDPTDYDKPESRDVIDTRDGIETQDQVNKFVEQVIQANPVPDGKKHFVVAENNPWFIRQDETHSLVGTPNIADTGNTGETGEVELLSFEAVNKQQLKNDENLRLAELDRQERLAEHIKSFEG